MNVIETRKGFYSKANLDQRDCMKIELTYDEFLDLKSILESIKRNREFPLETSGSWWINKMWLTTRDTRLVNNLLRKMEKADK